MFYIFSQLLSFVKSILFSCFSFLVFIMAPNKVYCRACNYDHPRPVGRNCKRKVGDAAVTVGSVSGPSQDNSNLVTATVTPSSDMAMILSKLTSIDDKVVSLDGSCELPSRTGPPPLQYLIQ